MSRYIDADALMQDINNSIDGMTTAGFTVDAEFLWGKLHDALEHAPSIDAVSVVRCRECRHKYQEPWNNGVAVEGVCEIWHSATLADDFCSYGERKGEYGERKGEYGERKGEYGERKGE